MLIISCTTEQAAAAPPLCLNISFFKDGNCPNSYTVIAPGWLRVFLTGQGMQ